MNDLWIIVWLLCIVTCALIGAKKGNPISGTFLGLALGPVGVLVCLLSGYANRRACPYCAEMIMKKAIVCPHCQRDVA